MKKSLYILFLALIGFTSCDKVENFLPAETDGDWSELYPDGDSADYVANEWPTFSANPNTDRNILLEDFTGHKCPSCPYAAFIAHGIAENNDPRVFISTIHSSPVGASDFQEWNVGDPYYYHNFTCEEGLELGQYLANIPFSGFFGNPRGLVNRVPYNGEVTLAAQEWETATNTLLSANELKVNLQAETNYFTETNGLFLHTEIDLIDPSLIAGDLRIVVQLHQDSIVRPQLFPGAVIDVNYVHRDIFLGCIDKRTFGQTLDAAHLDANGKYYFNYAYKLPVAYTADNVHLIIYVRDAVTEEVYQVIKKKF